MEPGTEGGLRQGAARGRGSPRGIAPSVLRTGSSDAVTTPPPAPSPKRRGGAEGKSLVLLPSPLRGGVGGGVVEMVSKRAQASASHRSRGRTGPLAVRLFAWTSPRCAPFPF